MPFAPASALLDRSIRAYYEMPDCQRFATTVVSSKVQSLREKGARESHLGAPPRGPSPGVKDAESQKWPAFQNTTAPWRMDREKALAEGVELQTNFLSNFQSSRGSPWRRWRPPIIANNVSYTTNYCNGDWAPTI
jgi:hypothetical protein